MKRMWFGLLMLFIQDVLSKLIIYKKIEPSTCGYLNEANKYHSSSIICYYSLIEFANDMTQYGIQLIVLMYVHRHYIQ